jgi:NIMA (never in mitosis gene a)-related kinase
MSSKYKVKKLLGEGSFGKAFLCSRDSDEDLCVIKQIKVEDMTKQEKDDVINESTILSKLDHPNIIKFFEFFESKTPQQTFNIVTEYADGGDLSEKIKEQNKTPFKESDILDYFTQICLALKHIHEKKIIHRDLKSGNVFLMKSGLVKLGDFGIAKTFKNTMDKAKTMVGTPYYLSPEIIQGKPYDNKSDIWSLGVLLYEMMTFKMPFEANTLPMLSMKIMRGNYTPPSSMYTKDLREIVSKCLMVDPSRRPSIREILKMPIIQNRIKNFLTEVEYKKEFTKTITKKYETKKKTIVKNRENAISGITEETLPSEISGVTLKTNENANKNSEKNQKILDYFKNKSNKKESMGKKAEKERQGFKDFLNVAKKTRKWNNVGQDQFNSSGVMWGKNQKPSANNMYKDDEDENKNTTDLNNLIESYDVNKITEEHYDKARFLNNLNDIVEDKGLDNEDENKNTQKNEKDDKANNKTIKEVDSDNDEDYMSEFKEIELMRIELEKILGLNLLKVAYHYVDDATDKKEIKYDKIKVEEKIKNDFGDKGFNDKDINLAIEKLQEIFEIVKKERVIEQ